MSYARQAAAKIAVSRSLDREGQGGHANDRKENKCSEIAILLSGSMLYFSIDEESAAVWKSARKSIIFLRI